MPCELIIHTTNVFVFVFISTVLVLITTLIRNKHLHEASARTSSANIQGVCTHHITALDSWQPERSSHFMILLMRLSISRRPLRLHQFSLSSPTWTCYNALNTTLIFYDLQTICISPKALKQIKLWPIFWKAAKSVLRSSQKASISLSLFSHTFCFIYLLIYICLHADWNLFLILTFSVLSVCASHRVYSNQWWWMEEKALFILLFTE